MSDVQPQIFGVREIEQRLRRLGLSNRRAKFAASLIKRGLQRSDEMPEGLGDLKSAAMRLRDAGEPVGAPRDAMIAPGDAAFAALAARKSRRRLPPRQLGVKNGTRIQKL